MDSTNYISGTYIVCSSSPQFVLSIMNEMDNETDPRCVLQCCDCQNRTFLWGQMDETDANSSCETERKREKKWEVKIKARKKRKETRQIANEERRQVGTFRDLSYLVKNRYSTSADTKLVAERTAVGKVSGTVVFIYYASRRWHQLDRAGRNIVEDATAGCNRVTTTSFTSFVLQVT